MDSQPLIRLYGTGDCHKTSYYRELLDQTGLAYQFLDVKENEEFADALRALYQNGKLNFPTITIGDKKLRNPRTEALHKWLQKLIPK